MRIATTTLVLGFGLATTALAQADSALVIKEKQPGLLAKAKIQPLDAQHQALAKYPDGKVVSGEITKKRGGELIYIFKVQRPAGHRAENVLVSALDGKIVSTIPLAKKVDTLPRKPRH